MKRRTVIRNVAASSLLVAGVGSAAALGHGSGSGRYEVRKDGGTFKVVPAPGGDVGPEHHCAHEDPDNCCKDKCCNCKSDCGICYCHEYCDDEDQEN